VRNKNSDFLKTAEILQQRKEGKGQKSGKIKNCNLYFTGPRI